METLHRWDQELFCYLHQLRADWLDTPMVWITGKWEWLPFYLFLIAVLVWEYRREVWKILLLIGLLVTATDRFTSGLMKPYFERLRPCQDPDILCTLDLITGCGGKFGFASSHAANTFGVATLLALLWQKKHRLAPGLWLWAALVSYSRVYVGVHYPGDILVGGLVGLLFGWAAYRVALRLV